MTSPNTRLLIVKSELQRRKILDQRLSEADRFRVWTDNVVTLPAFFARMISQSDVDPSAPDWLKHVAMYNAAGLESDGDIPPLFEDHVHPSRLVSRLLRIRHVLGMAMVSGEQLSNVFQQHLDRLTPLHRRLPDVLERYCSLLSDEGVRDHPGQMSDLLDVSQKRTRLPAPYGSTEYVEIRELEHLTELEFQLLNVLLQHVEHAKIEFSYNPERREAFEWVLSTVEKFERAGRTLDTVDPAFQIPGKTPDNALIRVRERIFRRPESLLNLDPITPDESLQFLETTRPANEYRSVARRVRSKLNDGVPPDEIAVVRRRDASSSSKLTEALASRDVPVLREQTGFSCFEPGILSLLQPVNTAFNTFQREDVLDLLRNTLLGGPARIDPEGLDRLFREAGITGGSPDTWRSRMKQMKRNLHHRLEAFASSSPDCSFFPTDHEHEKRLEHDLHRFRNRMEELFDFLETPDEKTTLKQLVERLLSHWNMFNVSSTITSTNPPGEHGRRNLRGTSAFRSFLDRLQNGLDHVEFETTFTSKSDLLEFFHGIWAEAARSSMKWTGPDDGVRILTPSQISGIKADHVIMMGMNEGTWPKPIHEDPFLTDDIIQALRSNKERSILQRSSDKRNRELYLFHQALSAAKKQVVFTWSRRDSDGTEQIPSPFLEDVKKLLSDAVVQTPDSKTSETGQENPAYTERERLIQMVSHRSQEKESFPASSNSLLEGTRWGDSVSTRIEHVLERIRLERLRDAFFMSTDRDERTERAGPWCGIISDRDTYRRLLRQNLTDFDTHRWSSTALERYAQCPYAYFSERILHLDETDEPILSMDRRREGLLLHELLRRLYTGDRSNNTVTDENINEACKNVFAKWEHYGFHGNDTYWAVKKERLRIRLRQVVRYLERNRSATERVHAERSFGGHRELPAVKFTSEDGEQMQLEGRIDRIEYETGRQGTVLDYKNARRGQKYRRLISREEFGTRSFQLPLYVLAVAQSSVDDYEDIESWSAGFITMREYSRKPELSTTVLDPSGTDPSYELEDLRRDLADGSKHIVNRILNGAFEVTPDPCISGCPYRSMCRYEKLTTGDD